MANGRTLIGVISGEPWRLGHRPALDGLRGVAILLVMASHLFTGPVMVLGTTGVTVFFTLSGFLITTVLLEHRGASGRPRLGEFYRHRIRRLGPALVVFLAVMLAASTATRAGFTSLGDVGIALGYASNWVEAFPPDVLGPIGHTWSLSIEEQFYLVWPALVVFALTRTQWRRWLYGITAAGCLWAVMARALLWDGSVGSVRLYMGTDTRMDALLIGCALAVWLNGRREHRARPLLADGALIVIAVGVLALHSPIPDYLLLPIWVPLSTAAALYALCGRGYRGLLDLAPLTWLGRRSYGLYLWHVAAIWLLTNYATAPRPVILVVAVMSSLAAAELSWRFVEQPFLRPARSGGSDVRSDAGGRQLGGVVRRAGDLDGADARAT